MKQLNFDVADSSIASASAAAVAASAEKFEQKKEKKNKKTKSDEKPAASTQNGTIELEMQPVKSKKDKKERAAIAEQEREAAKAKKERDTKLSQIASKTAKPAEPSSFSSSSKRSDRLLLEPTTKWMSVPLEPLSTGSAATASSLPHDRILSLLSQGNALLDGDNASYHALLNSGSNAKMASLGGITPSDAKFIASLLGDTTSTAGSGGAGGTLSDRIAAHALLLGSSPFHNLRSLDALLAMASKKGREESGRATRALADWYAGAGLGSARKLRYFRDQPELAMTAAASDSVGRDQRLAFFAFEDRLKKSYFAFLQSLENQSHDPLAFVRQQAVTQTFILLKEKSEQEQNLLRLLVNKLGDGERSVASKAMNNLLELLNVHPAMKAIVATEVGELIRKPTRSTSRAETENTKRHHNHAKYYGVLTLNQVILTRQDAAIANSLINLYFELFEQGLALQSERPDGEAEDGKVGEDGTAAKAKPKPPKNRWRDNKGGKGKGKGKGKSKAEEPATVQDVEGKMMAAVLTGVRRAFPFTDLEAGAFDKHIDTLFRITHSTSFNIAVQALQLIHVVASSASTTSSHLLDRFHSTLYSSLLDSRLASTSKTPMYLNLCFKAMRDDVDDNRRAAEMKRLLQTLGHMDVEFVCGALFLVAELLRAHPRLRTMMTDPEDDDDENILQPPDEEGGEFKAPATTASTLLANRRSFAYDAHKRDPRYAQAAQTCLWDIIPLLSHFHPTVRLLTSQLLQNQPLTTKPDLTLYSLSHFLDRFVYRNAKKNPTLQKGASGMQPGVAASGLEDGVRRVKGWNGAGEEVNTEKFWKKKAKDVPVDSLFFHHYFNLKESRNGGAEGKKAAGEDDEDEGGDADQEEDDDDDDDDDMSSLGSDDVDAALAKEAEDDSDASDADTDDTEEREIWEAMKRTMPKEDGDEDLLVDSGDEDQDDEDLEQFDYTDSEDEEAEEVAAPKGKASAKKSAEEEGDSDDDGLLESEDDLLPFADFDEDDDESSEDETTNKKGTKRSRGDDEEEGKPKSQGQIQRAEKARRKAMGTFASAEDYAHLLGGDDEENDEDMW